MSKPNKTEGMMKRCTYFLVAVFLVGLLSLALASEVEAAGYVWFDGIGWEHQFNWNNGNERPGTYQGNWSNESDWRD